MNLLFILIALFLLLFVFLRQRLFLYFFFFCYVWLYNYWWYSDDVVIRAGSLNIYLSDVLILAAAICVLINTLKSSNTHARSKLDTSMILFFIWLVICVLRGVPTWAWSAFGEARFLISSILYFTVAPTITDMTEFRRFLKVSGYIIVCYFIYLMAWRYVIQFQGNIVDLIHSRIMGTDTALNMVCVVIFIVTFWLNEELNRFKTRFVLVAILLTFSILLGARTGIIALSFSLFFTIVVNRQGLKLKPYFFMALTLIMIIITVRYFGLTSQGESLSITEEGGLSFYTEEGRESGTAAWRLSGWETLIWQTINENPILGEGFGGYFDIFDPIFKGVPPHNDWLLIFAKMGLIGLVLFANVVFQFYKIGFNYIKKYNDRLLTVYMKALMSIFLAGLVGGTFFFFFPFMWIVAGLQTALVNATKTNEY